MKSVVDSVHHLSNLRKMPKFAGSRGLSFFCSTEWRAFFVSCVIPVGLVRQHAPFFHSLLPRNHIHSAAKKSHFHALSSSPKSRFLRQLRHSSRSRAPARSLLSFLASSKLHPTGGKITSATSTRLTHEKRPNLRVPRGSAPWRGLGRSPNGVRRGLGQSPEKN